MSFSRAVYDLAAEIITDGRDVAQALREFDMEQERVRMEREGNIDLQFSLLWKEVKLVLIAGLPAEKARIVSVDFLVKWEVIDKLADVLRLKNWKIGRTLCDVGEHTTKILIIPDVSD